MSISATTMKSLSGLTQISIKRKHLRRYSWLPDVLRIKGSVFWRVLGPVLTVTIFATGVVIASRYGYNVALTNSVTPLLAVVVGLILVFRNSSSYDRYYEGRKDYGAMTANIRNLCRLIWVNVTLPFDESPEPGSATSANFPNARMTRVQVKAQKIRALKLCLSFAIAVKHQLREEYDTDYDDFIDVLPVDLFGKKRDPLIISLAGMTKSKSSWMSNSPRESSPLIGQKMPERYGEYNDEKKYPFPMILAHEITRMLTSFKRRGLMDVPGPAGLNGMTQLVHGLVDQMTSMERICNTPIPVSYSIHLKQCVTLYLFALPFTLIQDLDWKMVPIVTVVAFTLMGIEGIANEIEMPFGYDKSDLPLDKYCAELRAEVEYMIESMPEGYDDDWYRD